MMEGKSLKSWVDNRTVHEMGELVVPFGILNGEVNYTIGLYWWKTGKKNLD